MDWSLETIPTADGVRISPNGELDLVTAPLLARALRDAEHGHHAEIVLDLSGVSFMDSSGLAAVLESVQRCAESDLTLAVDVGAATGAVVRVLTLADVLDKLPLVGLEP